jgi:hypothetical protein
MKSKEEIFSELYAKDVKETGAIFISKQTVIKAMQSYASQFVSEGIDRDKLIAVIKENLTGGEFQDDEKEAIKIADAILPLIKVSEPAREIVYPSERTNTLETQPEQRLFNSAYNKAIKDFQSLNPSNKVKSDCEDTQPNPPTI